MKKAILISIKPKYVADILNGKKTIEIRKNCPKQLKGDGVIKPESIDVYIYCTKGKERLVVLGDDSFYCGMSKRLNGKVVAKFQLNCVEPLTHENTQEHEMTFNDWRTKTLNTQQLHSKAYLTYWEMLAYLGNKQGYAWHIDDLEVFDTPKELKEFAQWGFSKYYYSNHDKKPYAVWADKCERYHFGTEWGDYRGPQNWCYIEQEEE